MAKQVHIRVDDAIYEELVETPCKEYSYTFIDLFAGIGGMRIAFECAGGHCVYSNEWNKYSQKTYFANFGEQPDTIVTVEKNSRDGNHIWMSFQRKP